MEKKDLRNEGYQPKKFEKGYQPVLKPVKSDTTNPNAGYIPTKNEDKGGGNPPQKP